MFHAWSHVAALLIFNVVEAWDDTATTLSPGFVGWNFRLILPGCVYTSYKELGNNELSSTNSIFCKDFITFCDIGGKVNLVKGKTGKLLPGVLAKGWAGGPLDGFGVAAWIGTSVDGMISDAGDKASWFNCWTIGRLAVTALISCWINARSSSKGGNDGGWWRGRWKIAIIFI